MRYKSEFWLEGAKHWEKWSRGGGSSLRQVGHRATRGCFGAAAPARWVGGGDELFRSPWHFSPSFDGNSKCSIVWGWLHIIQPVCLSLLLPGAQKSPSVASGVWFPSPRANPCFSHTSQQSRHVLLPSRNSCSALD